MKKEFSKWSKVNGDYLSRYYEENNTLEYILPDLEGVYMWKINPTYKELSHNSPVDVINRLEKILTEPQGFVSSKDHHSISIEVSIKGKGMREKNDDIKEIAENPEFSESLIDFLDTINFHTPSLYVGQSGNLRKRIEQHLREETGFSERLGEDSFYSFDKLSMFYLDTSGLGSTRRVALEHIVTILTLGTYTRRIG